MKTSRSVTPLQRKDSSNPTIQQSATATRTPVSSYSTILQMQKMIGNQATLQLLRSRQQPIQRKTAQFWEAETTPGTYEPIHDLSLLGVKEAKKKKELEMIHFHATTINDFNSANSNADINQALNAQEDSKNSPEITQNDALQGCLNGYIQALDSVLRTERDYQKSPNPAKEKVDLALSKQGVTDMNELLKSVKDDLDGIKDTIDSWVQYQPADTMTYTDGVTKLLKESMSNFHLKLHTVKGIDHSAAHYLSVSNKDAGPAYEPQDKSVDALKKVVTLRTGVDENIAFDKFFAPVIESIVTSNGFNRGPLNKNDIAEPSGAKSAALVGLCHQTAPGLGGYAGRSVWGNFSGNKLEVHAIASHGSSNKHYNKESGGSTIPGSWRLA